MMKRCWDCPEFQQEYSQAPVIHSVIVEFLESGFVHNEDSHVTFKNVLHIFSVTVHNNYYEKICERLEGSSKYFYQCRFIFWVVNKKS